MKTTRLLGVLAAAALSLAWAMPANAQASRTWVSGVGDDANPCSRTAPCKTFAGAISKTATQGEIDALDPGGFGALTITKPITIDGGGGQVASVLVAGTNGIVVSAGASDKVILRNLRINGLCTTSAVNCGLSGVLFNAGGQLILEHDEIFGFQTAGVNFAPGGPSKLFIDDVHSQFNIGVGLLVAPGSAGTAGVEASRFYAQGNNDTGLKVVTNGGTGVANVVVRDSVFTGNTNFGVQATANTGTAYILLTNSTVTNSNNAGVNSDQGASNVVVGGNTISRNNFGLSQTNGATLNSYNDNYVNNNATANINGVVGNAGAKL